jgi:hypothetical protein
MELKVNKELFTAFVQFQSELNGLKPDSTNPHFKFDYISLDGILETVRPLLAKHGLAIMQDTCSNGDVIMVKTFLVHTSGEFVETSMLTMIPTRARDPQSMGSCITYAKRYQLSALIGVCESVDDDGNQASQKSQQQAKKDEARPQPTADVQSLRNQAIKLASEMGMDTSAFEAWLQNKRKPALVDMDDKQLTNLLKYLKDAKAKMGGQGNAQ